MLGQPAGRHVAQDVGRGDGLGERLQEATQRRGQGELHGQVAEGRDADLGPRAGRWSDVLGVLHGLDRVHDVGRRDRDPVMPRRALAQGDRPGRAAWLSTSQRSARSGTSVAPGPLRTRPLKTRATRSRSTWVRAVSGLTETGPPRMPSRYGRARVTGGSLGMELGVAAVGVRAGAPMRPATTASNRTRAPTTNVSVRVMVSVLGSAVGCRGARLGREDERGEREDDEQHEQHDGELPQTALDAATAPVDGRNRRRTCRTDRSPEPGAGSPR